MKNNITTLKTCLFCAKNYKEQKDIRGEEFVETMHEIEKIFIKYFQNEAKKYQEEIEAHFLDFSEIDKTTKIHKFSLEDFTETLKNLLSKAHFLGQKFLSKMLGKNFDGFYLENTEAVEYANNHAGELIKGIDETTRKAIQSILANAFASGWNKTETISAIQKEFEEFGKVRASLIAQMETALAHEHGEAVRFAKLAEEAGVTGWKRSQTQGDEKTRTSHRINEIDGWIENDKLFSGTGTLHAPHGFRCRCVTVRRLFEPSIDEKLEVHFEKTSFSATDEQKSTILESMENIRKKFPFVPKLKDIYDISDEGVLMHYHNTKHTFGWNKEVIENFNDIIVFATDSDAQKGLFWTIASASENEKEYVQSMIYHEFGHAIFRDIQKNNKNLFHKMDDILLEIALKINSGEILGTQYPISKWGQPNILKSEIFSEIIANYMLQKSYYSGDEYEEILSLIL